MEIESCLISDSIYNDGRHAKTVGKWVFKLREEKVQQVTKPSKPEVSRTNNDLTDSSKPAIVRKKAKKRK